MEKKYLTQKEVSKILNIQVQTLNHWRCTNKHIIPYIKLGRVILYPLDQFYEWLNSNSLNTNKEYNND